MIRKIISIEQDVCDGCGLCVEACHERAIGIVDGKAALLREDYCDGLGDCLPACPQNAITFIEKEALEYDEEAIEETIECETCGIEEESIVSFESIQVSYLHSFQMQITNLWDVYPFLYIDFL